MISSLVGRRVCSILHSSTYETAYTDAYKTHYTIAVLTTVLLKVNRRVTKHVEDIKKIKN